MELIGRCRVGHFISTFPDTAERSMHVRRCPGLLFVLGMNSALDQIVILILAVGLVVGLGSGCSRTGPGSEPPAALAKGSVTATHGIESVTASTPHTGPSATDANMLVARVRSDCLVPYAECPISTGLPALARDGTLVAVADRGPDSPRDERPLTIRLLDVTTGADVARYPVLTMADYGPADFDSMTGRFSTERLAELVARVEDVNAVLVAGGYRVLPELGRVYESQPGEQLAGMRASFDGTTLEVFDSEVEQVRWRRAILPSPAWSPAPEIHCGPFPVAEIRLWAAREPSIIVAYVSYIGADLCATEFPYLVWR